MATNRALKKALLAKLDVQSSALSKRINHLKNRLMMSTEDATYLIAFENGVKIDRYLTADQIDRVRSLHVQLSQIQTNSAANIQPSNRKKSANTPSAPIRLIRLPSGIRVDDPLIPGRVLNEAIAMSKVYPSLYVLENSMRELIKRVMTHHHGKEWWDTQLNSGKLKAVHKKAEDNMTKEKRKSWHQRRGDHPIDYVDLGDLEKIILGKQDHFFPGIISDREWFINFMKELYPSRNVVCHMNPLEKDNVSDVDLRVKKWTRMMREALNEIPTN